MNDYEFWRLPLEIGPDIFDRIDTPVEDVFLHDLLPFTIYQKLVDGVEPYPSIFNIELPNRFIPEGVDTEHWEDTEDAVFTGTDPREESTYKGVYALIQVVSCREKPGDGYDPEPLQLYHFEHSTQNGFKKSYMEDGLQGRYVVAADIARDRVPEETALLRETIADGNTYSVPVTIYEVPPREYDLQDHLSSLFTFLDSYSPTQPFTQLSPSDTTGM